MSVGINKVFRVTSGEQELRRQRFVSLLAFFGALILALPHAAHAQVNVTTQQFDIGRTGQNLSETILTPSNVNATTFGKLFSLKVDGYVYAQPLYLSNVLVNGGTHNAVFVATEHDSVYAFDADTNSGANASPLWTASMLSPAHGAAAGATTVPWATRSDIYPEVGITGTPVIDPTTNTLYVVSKSVEGGAIVQRLHALEVTTGAEKFGGPVLISASVPGAAKDGTGSRVTFNSGQENQRAGLLLLHGVIYVGWTAHEDIQPWHGWIIGYNAGTLQQTSAFCASPNGLGSGIWMSGNGLAADQLDTVNHPYGRMFVATGNGDYTATKPYTNLMDFGDSHLALDLSNGVIAVTDEFTTNQQGSYDPLDLDVGSGGVMVLPTQIAGSYPHLLVQSDKLGNIYLLNRDNLGGYNTTKNQALQILPTALAGAWSSPAYFNGTVYYWGVNDKLKAFPLVNGLLSAVPTESTEVYGFPGATPAISANGAADAIVWSVNSSAYSNGAAVLQAHSAANVAATLYSSSTNAVRDQAGIAVKFAVPTVANGKVYVGAVQELDVYGLLSATPPAATPTFTPASGTYTSSQTVTIADTTPGAKIYYTTNGAAPSTSSTPYSGPVTVSASETVRAIATASGYTLSAIGSAAYTINSGTTPIINDPTGFSSSSGLNFVAGAKLAGNTLQLSTASGGIQATAAWYGTPVNVQSFTTDFTFQLTSAIGDGFTFALQNAGANAVGRSGSSLGYQGMGSSVAIKFDLYNNSGEGNNSTGFYTNGDAPTVPALDLTSSGVNLHNGNPVHAHITYDGTTLSLTLTDLVTNAVFITSKAINIPATVGANTAYAGFTSGTYSAAANQSILNWTYSAGGASVRAATPTFTPAPGTYTSSQTVTIADTTPGAKIYYTTNGAAPTTASTPYGGPVTVSASETVQAIATASGYTLSAIGSAAYTINSGTTPIINDPTGFSSSSGLNFVAGAKLAGNTLQLSTASGGIQATAAWYGTPVNVQSFTTDFTFQLTSAIGDGFTFALQNAGANAVGRSGMSLGYQGMGSSVAIKFDLYNNSGEGNNSTGFYTNGDAPTVPALDLTSSGVNLHNGNPVHAHITYDGTTLSLTLTDLVTNAVFITSKAINIPATVGANTAYAGFTSGTYSAAANQSILNWTYSAGGASSGATPINDPTGFSSSSGLNFVAGAKLAGNTLQLSTASGGIQATAAWYGTPVNVQSFTTDFTFQLTSAIGDGFTFALQNAGANAVGRSGMSLGYQGMGSSVAIKFDLYNNSGEGNNSTGFYTNGDAPTVPALDLSSSGVNLHNGNPVHAHITYDGTTLSLTLTDLVTNAIFITSKAINIPATVGANTAYAGFTSGTYSAAANQSILNWTYSVH